MSQPKHHRDQVVHDGSRVSSWSRGRLSAETDRRESGSRESEGSSPQAVTRRSDDSSNDFDSNQIIQMALNLSESRRTASHRRQVSRGTPPRLGPVPDGSSGSNLRQHLLQQRKSSSTGAARTLQGPSPRPPSGRFDGPLQTGLDSSHDYRYHFSASTLARAQKAKDHLELMAQYRRLLGVLPPLKPGVGQRTTSSPPPSSVGSQSFPSGPNNNLPMGRQYNPLQYIRNRKVRARERKVIDGEALGFGDVNFVKPWVDQMIARATSPANNQNEDSSIVTPLPGAGDADNPDPLDQNARAAARVRRPRIDWVFEPCDVVADAYWLEQQDHKELIEDRNWRKIFPAPVTVLRETKQEAPVEMFESIPPFSMRDDDELDAQISGVSKIDTGLSHNSAKDRAKQTIHNIRAFPHRHNGHSAHADFMWHKKDSTSDISDSENDGKRFAEKTLYDEKENGTVSQKYRHAVEDQMLDMVSRDARQRDLFDAVSGPEATLSLGSLMTPERHVTSQPSSRLHSRGGSIVDTSDSDWKHSLDKALTSSPPNLTSNRQSLDASTRPREDSLMQDVSLPTSPEVRPRQQGNEVAGGFHLPPTESRPASPHRNPISKIKQIIRDKSGELVGERDDSRRGSISAAPLSSERLNLVETRPSSPLTASGPDQMPLAPSRSHRRTGSTRLRPDEQPGLRGMFKGPRIDSVIRGGVSKLGEMLWKREEIGESPSGTDVTDESEGERARGRSWSSANVSRRQSRRRLDDQSQSKPVLEAVPFLKHAYSLGQASGAEDGRAESGQTPAKGNLRSSRLDGLRPPRIDTRGAPSPGHSESQPHTSGNSEALEKGSRQGLTLEGVPITDQDSDPSRAPDDGGRPLLRKRHWSIADKDKPAEEARFTRREIARLRALVLSTGIKAMEISRRAQEKHGLHESNNFAATQDCFAGQDWRSLVKLCDESALRSEDRVAHSELYIFVGRSLGTAVQKSGRRWQIAADQFAYRTSPQLQNRVGDIRSRIADDLSEQSRQISDLADETSRDLALGQPLKIKAVVDTIDQMLRRRRRRLRWLRRALWLIVEWLLVGFMWYVWFMVVILRVFLGMGKAAISGVRWLLWL